MLTLYLQPVFSAQSVIVDSTGQACMGEDKSRKQTEQAAMAEAKRKAVERVSTQIRSETDIKDFTLEKDLVSAYANAEVKVIKETDCGWYKDPALGDCYRVNIRAEITPTAEFAGHPAGSAVVKQERAELDRRGIEYKTSIFLKAIKEGNTDIAELFIKAGIDVNAKTESEGTPALILAILKGNARVSMSIIEAGANLNAADNYGTTPLYAASEKGITEVVQALIARGADVTKGGPAAMVIASRWGFGEIVKALLNAGVQTKGEKVVKAMSQAADFGHTSVVKLLLENGAEVNAKDFSGYTPLARAVGSNKKETVLLLIDKGADMNNRDKFGMTPLMRAVQAGHTDMVKLLIDKGADKDLKDNNGTTAIMWAVKERAPESLKALVDAKGDINAVDKDGKSALALAKQKGDQNLINILEKK
jgi:uncharacterized protein